jgi:predicted DNA-binding transcriptional regulator YafY
MEIQRWVLSWGGDVQVLKPRELSVSVQEAAQEILRQGG